MRLGVSVESNINIPAAMAKIRDPAFRTFAAMEWYRLYRDYCPRDTGVLYESVRIGPFEIEHIAPYAGEVYAHNKNYRTDKAPRASAHWDMAAAPAQKPKLIASLQRYIDSGRIVF